jgi:murein DD-endopeptidase MepM/ murein hydrolase activator NlpD
MLIRRLCASLLLLCATLGASTALASLATYPFRVETRRNDTAQEVVARNNGPAPIWVRVNVKDAENLIADRPWPIAAVVPAGEQITLVTLRAANPARAFRFGLVTAFSLGDPTAQHDRAARYRMPYADGLSFPISQAPGTRPTTHTTLGSANAVDFTMPSGTPIVAARAGIVVDIDLSHTNGGQDTALMDKANVVQLLHPDGTLGLYAHLKPGTPLVTMGQRVRLGEQIGWSGNTGFSSGPHLHFAVLKNVASHDGLTHMESLPFELSVGPALYSPHVGLAVLADYANIPEMRASHPTATVASTPPPRANQHYTFVWLDRPPLFWLVAVVEGVLLFLFLSVLRNVWRR